MNPSLQHLYQTVNEDIMISCTYREKIATLATAKATLLDRLDEICDKEARALVDVYTLLDEERQTLHEQALFESALTLGIQLGQLNPQQST